MKNGGIIIYPTESSYALGCRYNDQPALRRLKQLKGRTDDRFTLVASSLAQVKKHFMLTPAMEQLAIHYWPGALSIVVSKKFAIRVPDLTIARKLAGQIGAPVVATSLNVSGEPPVFDLRQLVGTTLELSLLELSLQALGVSVIDIGILPKRPPSTIVECFRGGYVNHRPGAVNVL